MGRHNLYNMGLSRLSQLFVFQLIEESPSTSHTDSFADLCHSDAVDYFGCLLSSISLFGSPRNPAFQAARQATIWGFDNNFTKYTFKNLNIKRKHLNFTPLASYCSKENKGCSEIIVGEIIVKFPYKASSNQHAPG